MSIYDDFNAQIHPLLAKAEQLGFGITGDMLANMETTENPAQAMHAHVVYDLQSELIREANRLNDRMLYKGVDPDTLLSTYLDQADALNLLDQIHAYAYRVEATRQARATT